MRSDLEQRLRNYLENVGQRGTASLDMPALYRSLLDRVSEVTPGNGADVGPDVARSAADLLLEHCGLRSVIFNSAGKQKKL